MGVNKDEDAGSAGLGRQGCCEAGRVCLAVVPTPELVAPCRVSWLGHPCSGPVPGGSVVPVSCRPYGCWLVYSAPVQFSCWMWMLLQPPRVSSLDKAR